MSDTTIILTGNLGRDPERKRTQSGKALVTASVAVQQGKDDTAWYRLTAWQDEAPGVASTLAACSKGRRVDVVGRLRMRRWTGQDGAEHNDPEVTVDRVRPWPPKDGEQPQRGQGRQDAPPPIDEEIPF